MLVKKVKAGWEECYADFVAKLENIELEAKAKVEEMIAEDKEILNNMIAEITYEEEVEEEPETEIAPESTPDYISQNF